MPFTPFTKNSLPGNSKSGPRPVKGPVMGPGNRAPASGLDRLGATPKMLNRPPTTPAAQTGPFTIASPRSVAKPYRSPRGRR